jgi:hypothetical protein
MPRRKSPAGNLRRTPAGGRAMKRRRTGRGYQPDPDYDIAESADFSDDIDPDDEWLATGSLHNIEARRRIEMLREERLLQQDLCDIYDA